jgi:hypothetical protein
MILDGAFEMWDWLTKKKTPPVKEEKEKVIRVPRAPEKTAKQIATENNEPYVAIVTMDIDPNNLHQGAFELDWNEIFIARLVKAGYMMKPTDADSDIVDRWFQNVCRHVVMETWEQDQAMRNSASGYVHTRDIGDGRSEVR